MKGGTGAGGTDGTGGLWLFAEHAHPILRADRVFFKRHFGGAVSSPQSESAYARLMQLELLLHMHCGLADDVRRLDKSEGQEGQETEQQVEQAQESSTAAASFTLAASRTLACRAVGHASSKPLPVPAGAEAWWHAHSNSNSNSKDYDRALLLSVLRHGVPVGSMNGASVKRWARETREDAMLPFCSVVGQEKEKEGGEGTGKEKEQAKDAKDVKDTEDTEGTEDTEDTEDRWPAPSALCRRLRGMLAVYGSAQDVGPHIGEPLCGPCGHYKCNALLLAHPFLPLSLSPSVFSPSLCLLSLSYQATS